VSRDLYSTIREIIQDELRQIRTAELGVVQDIHPHAEESDSDNYACTVMLRNSGIVLPRVPVATQRIGTAAIPNLNDLVLVQFIDGDINAPVITGRFYNDQDRPPPNDKDRLIARFPPDGDMEFMADGGDAREFSLTIGDALKIRCRDDDPVLTIQVQGGKATIQVDSDGTVTIESGTSINFKGGDVKIAGTSIALEADGEMKIKGAIVNIN